MMKKVYLALLLFSASLGLKAQSFSTNHGYTKLFNGKNLDGWQVKAQKQDQGKTFWTVEDGAILCNSAGSKDHDYIWLLTEKEYGDFELRLKFKVSRENKGNSGVQIRSRYDHESVVEGKIPGWLDGPQVDIEPGNPWRNGLIYDETRTEKRWISPSLTDWKITKDNTSHPRVIFYWEDQISGWNDMTIICQGTKIKTFVNNFLVSDFEGAGLLDNEGHRMYNVGLNGHIALQLHKNSENKIWFKDIEVRELKCLYLFAQDAKTVELVIAPGEYWWAGISSLGHQTPYNEKTIFSLDMWGDNKGNQAQPLLLSSKGRYVWSEEPIKYDFNQGKLTVSVREGKILSGTAGSNLRSAYEFSVKSFFPPDGRIPDPLLFTHPQYNTWIELMYDQNENDILAYAENIIKNGYSPGVLMIDDNWQEDYGNWDFSPRKFSDPKGMIKKLHEMGFKVMVWICPFVSADSEVFRKLAKEGMLVLDPQKSQEILWANTSNKAAIIRWWNGASACLDLSNPKTQKWFKERLDYLVNEYGVDGFKFDAGDAGFYTGGIVSFNVKTPNDHTSLFAELGLHYPLNEYRASWKMAGLPLAQRLRDKTHKWSDLAKLIPDQMSQSVMGYAYTCPDMIGGGEYQSFLNGATIDEELVVRSAQVHALMPMMQFSVAPWRVLSKENADICLKMSKLHEEFGGHILTLAKEASKSGEPIVKPMELAFPGNGYESIMDQFVLGNDIIVAPVTEKGARSRKVFLPKGNWIAEDGKKYKGGSTIEVSVPLERLPYFRKIN